MLARLEYRRAWYGNTLRVRGRERKGNTRREGREREGHPSRAEMSSLWRPKRNGPGSERDMSLYRDSRDIHIVVNHVQRSIRIPADEPERPGSLDSVLLVTGGGTCHPVPQLRKRLKAADKSRESCQRVALIAIAIG